MIDKKVLRKELIKKRKELSLDYVQENSKIIVSKIRNLNDYQKAKVVGIYYPFMNEVDLLELLVDDKIFAFPRVVKDDLEFIVTKKDTVFKMSNFKVLEPINGKIVNEEIDLLICPAVGVSKDNYRIGFGKGYYDRYLKRNRPKIVISVIYDFQEVDFKESSYDQKLDFYIRG